MKIGILQAGHFPAELHATAGDYTAMYSALLKGHGLTFQTWSVVDMEFPASPADADGWLISGSKHGAYEDVEFIPPLEDFIRAIDAAHLPLIGVCFGHQIVAQALGGRVEKFSGGWSVGRTEYRQGDKVLTLNAWHQDQVIGLPPRARVLASSDFCQNAILAYGDNILTIQPHPEFGPEAVRGLCEVRGPGIIPDELLKQARAGADEPTDRLEIGAKMAAFFLRNRVEDAA